MRAPFIARLLTSLPEYNRMNSSRNPKPITPAGEDRPKRNPASALAGAGFLDIRLWIDPQAKAPHLRASSRPIRDSSSMLITPAASELWRRAVRSTVERLVVIGAE